MCAVVAGRNAGSIYTKEVQKYYKVTKAIAHGVWAFPLWMRVSSGIRLCTHEPLCTDADKLTQQTRLALVSVMCACV